MPDTDNQNLYTIMDSLKDQTFQEIIDRMEGIQGIEENKLPGDDPSERALTNWTRELDKLERAAKRKTPHRKRFIHIAMVAVLLLSFLLISVNAHHILNWFGATYEKYTKLQQTASIETEIKGWKDVYLPEYVPEDYTISDGIATTDAKSIEYTDTEGHRIMFYQYSPQSNIMIDTEAADKTMTSAVAGHTAYVFHKNGLTTLYWDNGIQTFSIEFSTLCLTEDEAIQMAESIQLQNK